MKGGFHTDQLCSTKTALKDRALWAGSIFASYDRVEFFKSSVKACGFSSKCFTCDLKSYVLFFFVIIFINQLPIV